MADKALAVIGKFFSWLIARDVVDASPCRGVERPVRNPPRDRVLDDREIVALWNACAGEGPAGQAVKLLLMTGCRKPRFWGTLERDRRRRDALALTAQRTKNAHPHVVPLAPQAWAIIAAQPRFAGCDYIFTTDGRRSIGGFSRLKSDSTGRCSRRRLGSCTTRGEPPPRDATPGPPSRGDRTGAQPPIGTFRGIVGVYQRHDYIDERRIALQRWADFVEQLVSGQKRETVVPMRGRRR